MIPKHRLFVGYDLTDEYAQISYYQDSLESPTTISMIAGEEAYCIPTVLFKPATSENWQFGQEAITMSKKVAGTLFWHLVDWEEEEVIQIEGVEYTQGDLLEIFIRKTLNFLQVYGSSSPIEAIAFTFREIKKPLVNAVKDIMEKAGVPGKQVLIRGYEESIYSYVIHQNKELFSQNVLILQNQDLDVKSFFLTKDITRQPMVCSLVEGPQMEFLSLRDKDQAQNDHMLERFFVKLAGKARISGVLLSGEIFSPEKTKNSLATMCRGRKVHIGKNLYTLGACYSVMEQYETTSSSPYVFQGRNRLEIGISIPVKRMGVVGFYQLLKEGTSWFDAGMYCEIILDEEKDLRLTIQSVKRKISYVRVIPLKGLPERPRRATRLGINVECEDRDCAVVTVTDMGFGEMYPASGRTWIEKIAIQEVDE